MTSKRHVFVWLCLSLTLSAVLRPGICNAQEPLEVLMRVGRTPLPLESERLRVTIDSQHASTQHVQVYTNDTPSTVEGQFELRLAEGSAVTGYAYWNGEAKIVGKVFELEAARRIYEHVTSRRRDPGLLEKLGEGRFGFKVFPIEPGENKRVQIEHAAWLDRRGDRVEYRAPLGSRRASILFEIHDTRGIGTVRSGTHQVHVDRMGSDRVRVRATAGSGSELHLSYQVSRPAALSVQLHRDENHDGYFNLAFNPRLSGDASEMPKDITLVLDRSGSMAHEAFHQAQRAAVQIIQRLHARDSVNVIWFDDDVDALFTSAQPMTDDVRRQALNFVHTASLGGGTNIAGALAAALRAQSSAMGRLPIVLFMTDGQSDSERALDVSERGSASSRVFTVGVGPSVDRAFLARLAKSHRGTFTFIERSSAIERRIADLYAQIEEPQLVDLELEVKGVHVHRQYPRSLPDLFRNDEVLISGRFRGRGPIRFTLRGHQGQQVREYTVHVPSAVTSRPWVGRLWARARVDELLEDIALRGGDEELRQEVVRLSLAYDFVTPFTAFLAIPESEVTADVADMMASAHAQRERARSRHEDAVALSGDLADEGLTWQLESASDGTSVPLRVNMEEEAVPHSLPAGSAPPKNGCGACSVGSPEPPTNHWALLLTLVGIAWRRRAPR